MKIADAPRAKREGVLTERVGGELVVVDTTRNKAHCLNESSAFVWQRCDGATSVAEIARMVEKEWNHENGDEVTRLALDQLVAARLVEGALPDRGGMNRRTFLSKSALAAAAIPVIVSVLAPAPIHAQSCGTKNDPCGLPGTPPCCPGFRCNFAANKCK